MTPQAARMEQMEQNESDFIALKEVHLAYVRQPGARPTHARTLRFGAGQTVAEVIEAGRISFYGTSGAVLRLCKENGHELEESQTLAEVTALSSIDLHLVRVG